MRKHRRARRHNPWWHIKRKAKGERKWRKLFGRHRYKSEAKKHARSMQRKYGWKTRVVKGSSFLWRGRKRRKR
jgi:hypothetical protein